MELVKSKDDIHYQILTEEISEIRINARKYIALIENYSLNDISMMEAERNIVDIANLGWQAFLLHRQNDAVELMQQVLRHTENMRHIPERLLALNCLTIIYIIQKDDELAEKYSQEALELMLNYLSDD